MPRKSQQQQDTKKLRFIGYARISKEGEDDDREAAGPLDALGRQHERLRGWAVGQEAELVGFEQDTITGGSDPRKRPGYGRVLEALRRGEADGIVVVALDRLSRSLVHTLEFLEDARRRGWVFVSLREQVDTSTPTGQFILSVLAAIAQYERGLISERTRQALRSKMARGEPVSSRVPFGYRLEGDQEATRTRKGETRKLVPYLPEQTLLTQLRALHADGLGSQAITDQMNVAGGTNPRTGRPWSRSVVRSILRTAARRG